MVRTREESFVAEQTPREAYVAGMRCAGTRSLTARETRQLQWLGYGGLVAGVIAGVSLPELFRRGPWAESGTFLTTILLVAATFALLAALVFVGPALRTLRAGIVFLFRGAARNLGPFDGNQFELFGNKPGPEEIVVLANGRTVYQIDGVNSFMLLPLQRPSAVARDRGPETRPLSEAEKRELREISRCYRRPNVPILMKIVTVPLVMAIVMRRIGPLERWGILPFLSVAAFLLLLGVAAHWTQIRFALRLRRDWKAGTLTDGRLASGVPWLAEGEPASWRLARPRSAVFLNVEALLKL